MNRFLIFFFILINFHAIFAKIHGHHRIIGGKKAFEGQFPFIVLINYKCGGSVLTENHVLTAGHCVTFLDYRGKFHFFQKFVLMFGQTRVENNQNWVHRTAKKVMLHENFSFNGQIFFNDIAILEFSKPLEFGKTIQAVKLSQISDEAEIASKFFTTIGWGLTDDGYQSNDLLFVDMKTISLDECQATLDEILYKSFKLNEGIMCVESTSLHPLGATCNGDSGGPLVVEGTNLLVGITSWGPNNCTRKPHPYGFTRVAFYLDWIYGKIGKK
ncbi:trypsin-1-like [Culicoides brevitarsis]|uniref:trypsin-1-like n=1 Tax=Culicoides brevitarsis TaxID=469753 RepID=UPI00307C265E